MATLLDTTDAMAWAEEFCRLFDGWQVWAGGPDDRPQVVDESLMITWFANAIETGRREGAQAHCPHTARSILGEDLEVCQGCGKLNPGG